MDKFVVLVNDGLWDGGKVFVGLDSVKKLFKDVGVKEWIIEGEKVSFKYGIDMMLEFGEIGERLVVENSELCEMGDDECHLSICKLNEG